MQMSHYCSGYIMMITASKNRQNLFDSIFKLVFHIFHIKYDKKKSSNPYMVNSRLSLKVNFKFTLLLLILSLLNIKNRKYAKVIMSLLPACFLKRTLEIYLTRLVTNLVENFQTLPNEGIRHFQVRYICRF